MFKNFNIIFITLIGYLFIQNIILQMANKDLQLKTVELQTKLLLLEQHINSQQILLHKIENGQLFLKTSAVINNNGLSWIFWGSCILGIGAIIAFSLYSFSPQGESILHLTHDQNNLLAKHVTDNTNLIRDCLNIIQEDNKSGHQNLVDHLLIVENLIERNFPNDPQLALLDVTCNAIRNLPCESMNLPNDSQLALLDVTCNAIRNLPCESMNLPNDSQIALLNVTSNAISTVDPYVNLLESAIRFW